MREIPKRGGCGWESIGAKKAGEVKVNVLRL
jgi:hypothetical protein